MNELILKSIFVSSIFLVSYPQISLIMKFGDMKPKKIDDTNIDFKMSSFISQNDINKIHSLFKAFDKIEFMRVDGRMYQGEFHLIELSPDCYLGDDCAFYYAFGNKGYSLSQMFEYLIVNSLNHYQL